MSTEGEEGTRGFVYSTTGMALTVLDEHGALHDDDGCLHGALCRLTHLDAACLVRSW
jgi:hypothetical protein